jgi:hypothetical protein
MFVLFEASAQFFEHENFEFQWDLAFHPARCLEYEISLGITMKRLNLFRIYNSESYERLIECVCVVRNVNGIRFKEQELAEVMDGRFQRFIVVCVLFFAGQSVPSSSVKHLLALAYAPSKFNDAERFRKTVTERVKAVRGWLPFIGKESDCSFDLVLRFCADEQLLEQAVAFVEARIAAA